MVSFLIILLYLIILIPYVIISNAGETGIVIDRQNINSGYLSEDMRDILINQSDSYNIIVIEDIYPKEIVQISNEWDQVAKEKKIILSGEDAKIGSFVRIDDVRNYMYVPYNVLPPLNQSFEKFITGNPEKAQFGGVIESIYNNNLVLIYPISKLTFYMGGLLVMLILTYLLHNKLKLWNIPAIITCYSFQFFLGNMIASMNHLKIETTFLLFGFIFILTIPVTFKLRNFEDTIEGKRKIVELYKLNINFMKRITEKMRFGRAE